MSRTSCMVIALTLLLAGCRRDEAVDPEAARVAVEGARIELTGCLGVAPGAPGYALRRIQFPTDRSAVVGAAVPGVTEDAWVRLEGDAATLKGLLNQHVRLEGHVIDSGRNTIGTAGSYGYETPSGDRSQAASDQHYASKQALEAGRIARESLANGRAAEVRVNRIERIEPANCAHEPPPEKRR